MLLLPKLRGRLKDPIGEFRIDWSGPVPEKESLISIKLNQF